MDTLISRIRKNASEEIWIALTNYEGHDLLDIRAYFRSLDGFQPTRKGIAVGVSKLEALRGALESVLAREMADTTPVIIPKNSSEEIRVYQSEYMGHRLMNIRVHFSRKKGSEMEPSHKGIAFNVNLTGEVIRAINLATNHTSNA